MSAPVATVQKTVSPVEKVVKPKTASSSSGNKVRYLDMITVALRKLNERSGSSRQAIVKYICANYPVDPKIANQHVKLALKTAVKGNQVKQTKGVGASGSFKIGEGIKLAEKVAAKKVKDAAKPKKVVKKPVAKKTVAKKAVAASKNANTAAVKSKKATTGTTKKTLVVNKKKISSAKPAGKAVKPAAKKSVATKTPTKNATAKKPVAAKKVVAKKPVSKKAAAPKKVGVPKKQ